MSNPQPSYNDLKIDFMILSKKHLEDTERWRKQAEADQARIAELSLGPVAMKLAEAQMEAHELRIQLQAAITKSEKWPPPFMERSDTFFRSGQSAFRCTRLIWGPFCTSRIGAFYCWVKVNLTGHV